MWVGVGGGGWLYRFGSSSCKKLSQRLRLQWVLIYRANAAEVCWSGFNKEGFKTCYIILFFPLPFVQGIAGLVAQWLFA